VALLQPKRVDRLVPAGDEPVRLASVPERVPEREPELAGAVELPAELADVRHPQREARNAPDRELVSTHVWESVVCKVDARERLEDVARPWTPQPEAGVRRRLVDDLDR